MAKLHSLKVGIDFGTTYSGVAWAHTATPDEINVIQRWPAGGNRNSEKVPTEIAYSADGTSFKWGFELPLECEKLIWIKLLLDPSKYDSNSADSPLSKTKHLIPAGKEPVDVVADYLGALKRHTVDTLERNFGKEFLEATPIDWVMTVPAVWSDAAKAMTLRAAEAAGLGGGTKIRMISEPDAAAVCTLRDIQPNSLRVDDTFIVVDCGGGTVDLISYQITALKPTLEVKECAVGTGGMHGSTYINANFENFVRKRIGDDVFNSMKPKGRIVMLKHFDEFLKRTFSDEDEDEDEDIFSCPIPGVADNEEAGVEDGFFILTREEMKGIFDPVISQIVGLVQKQMDCVEGGDDGFDVSAILLVGGFGASEYLRQRLFKDLKSTRNPDVEIEILQPTNAWSAVVRGAVLRGLEGGIVRSRHARRHYGVNCTQYFDPDVHDEAEKYLSSFDGTPKVRDRAFWYIKKGDEVSEDKPISFPFYNRWKTHWDEEMEFEGELVASELDEAPIKTNSTDTYLVCKLTSRLPASIPKDIFPKRTSPYGFEYYDINYNLIMTVESATLTFEFEFDGKTYGSVTAKYY